MDDLAAFVSARLDEDEAAANSAVHKAFSHWYVEPWHDGSTLKDGRTEHADVQGKTGYQVTGNGALTSPSATHIARHDPARVLREIAAKRAILATYTAVAYMDIADLEPEFAYGRAVGLGEAVRHLATIWSDHPDYQARWTA